MNSDEPSAFYLLATALRSTGRNEESRAALRRVAELHTKKLDAEKQALQDANVIGAR